MFRKVNDKNLSRKDNKKKRISLGVDEWSTVSAVRWSEWEKSEWKFLFWVKFQKWCFDGIFEGVLWDILTHLGSKVSPLFS